MTREKKLAWNTGILSLGTFLPKAAAFITLPVLTGGMSQADYGIYDLITILESLVLPAATLQIQTAAFRYLIDAREEKEKQKAIISNTLLFTLLVSLAVLSAVFVLMRGRGRSIRFWICLYFFADILVSSVSQIARGLNRCLDYSVSAVLSAVGRMVFAVVLVGGQGMGLKGGVMALAGATVFALCFLSVRLRLYRQVSVRACSFEMIRQLLRYSWPMVPNSMSMWVVRVSDRLIITAVLGVSANAVYAVANKIPSMLNLIQNTFVMAWQENASLVSRDADAADYYARVFRRIYDLMAGCLGMMLAGAPLLFALLVKGSYDAAFLQMPILFMGMFFYGMSACLGGIYVAYKATRSVGITTFAAAVCNLLLNLLLIRKLGLYAASLSTLFSYLFLFVFRLVHVRKLVKIRFDYLHLVLVFGVLVLECGLCYVRKPAVSCAAGIFGGFVFVWLNKVMLIHLWRRGMEAVQNVIKERKQ